MLKKILPTVLAILLLVTSADAMVLDGRCEVRFFGKSTLHDFDGKVTCQPFSLHGETSASGGDVLRAPVISILVKEMDTDISGRNKKMQAMFESDRFPTIQGKFTDLDPVAVLQQLKEGGETAGHLAFDLQIRETSKPVVASTRDFLVTPEQISFRMEFSLSLADYQLEPASILGLIRVDDQVRVEVMVVLNRH
jgi:hypothetical protein